MKGDVPLLHIAALDVAGGLAHFELTPLNPVCGEGGTVPSVSHWKELS